jgi:hypothetical protein
VANHRCSGQTIGVVEIQCRVTGCGAAAAAHGGARRRGGGGGGGGLSGSS